MCRPIVKVKLSGPLSGLIYSETEFLILLTCSLLEGLDPIYYPMIWFETVTSLDDSMVDMMKMMTASPSIGLGIGIGSICIGVIMCVLSFFLVIRHRRMTQFA